MNRRLAVLAFLLLAASLARAEEPTLENRVRAFLAEKDPAKRAPLRQAVLDAKPDPAALVAAIAAGWPAEGPKGRATWTRSTPGGPSSTVFAYVPESYEPGKAWPVLLWLHGGVARDEDGGGDDILDSLQSVADMQGFLVLSPSSRRGLEWWTPAGAALVRGALRDLAARWHVDPDRVLVAGFSDGASGCFHLLAHDPDPYAAFVAFMPLPTVTRLYGGPTFGANVGARPLWAVNGGRDPLYPADKIEPLIEELKKAGAKITWRALPQAAHDLSVFSEVGPEVFQFWQANPRPATEASLSWETAAPAVDGRRGWIEVVEVKADAPAADGLGPTELKTEVKPTPRLGITMDQESAEELRIASVQPGSAAQEAGFLAGDVVVKAGETEIKSPDDFPRLRQYIGGLGDAEGTFTVKRDGKEIVLKAKPRVIASEVPPRPKELGYDVPSGRVAATASSGKVELKTRGVAALRLSLVPSIWKPGQELVVTWNGKEVHKGVPTADLGAMLDAAASGGPLAPIPYATLTLKP